MKHVATAKLSDLVSLAIGICEGCKGTVFRSKPRCKCGTWRPDVAAKREAEGKGEDLDGKCLTCLDARADVLLIKCKHLCLCQECVKKVQGKCPICRESFDPESKTEVMKLFV